MMKHSMVWASLWITSVMALGFGQMAVADGAAPGPQGGITPFLPLLIIFGIFYFLILRPQQRKQKQHEEFLGNMKRGDMVITTSGIIGTIKTLSDKFVTLEVDDKVCLKILRSQISESANTLKEESKPKGSLLNQLQEERK